METLPHEDVAHTEVSFDLESLPLKEKVQDSKFRIQNQYLFLTYARCDFVDKAYKEWLGIVLPQYIECTIATENHKDGTPHKHVLINRGKNFQTKNSKFFDYEGFHPNIVGIMPNVGDYLRVLAYISKYDEKLNSLNIVSKKHLAVISSASLSHALVEGSLCGLSAMNTKTIYEAFKADNKPQLEPVSEPKAPWIDKMREYQENLIDRDVYRDILWFYDKFGNSHKTHFANYVFDDPDYCVITSVDTCKDFMRIIYNSMKRGWTMKYLIFLLPRNWIDREGGALYKCIETAKDGIITMNKFDSDRFRISQKVLIVVLANTMPNIGAMTLDKWHLYNIHSTKEVSRISFISTKHTGGLDNVRNGPPTVQLNKIDNYENNLNK